MSSRSSADGHRLPVMCSFSASPLPTPSVNRPPVSSPEVAAAWAVIAGCTRIVEQVTAVVTGRLVAAEIAPITDQTKLLCPCSSSQGWKWSEIHKPSKPACSASSAWRTSSCGGCSSEARK
jgi:hypothetical protein